MKRTLSALTIALLTTYTVYLVYSLGFIIHNVQGTTQVYRHTQKITENRPSISKRTQTPNVTNRPSISKRLQTSNVTNSTSISYAKKDLPSVRIAVAIPTHNRRGYVRLCADALRGTVQPKDIWVFDDASYDYSVDNLRNWFGTQNVKRFDGRQKADLMGRTIIEWFAEHESIKYDWVVTLDSDLIVHPKWLSHLRDAMSKTDGVISLYHSGNAANHPVIQCSAGLCTLESLGNAGIVWRIKTARHMLKDVSNRANMYDWGWSNWCKTHGVRLMTFEKSLVVHVGMHGTWGADSVREKAVGFDMNALSPHLRQRVEDYVYRHKPPN